MPSSPDARRLHEQALTLLQQGRRREAMTPLQQLLQALPDDLPALSLLGQLALQQGDLGLASQVLAHAAQLKSTDPEAWTNLAVVQQRLGDELATQEALTLALEADPSDLLALLMRGKQHERLGRQAQAAQAYGAAAAVAPPFHQLAPELRSAVQHAMAYREAHTLRLAAHMDAALAPAFEAVRGESLGRFALSLDILLGRKRRFDAQPMRYFVPELAPVEFFDRSHFPWIEALEAGTPLVQAELRHVLRDDLGGLSPYIEYAADHPVAQWEELNHSPRWSAYHLWKDGRPVAEHVARCPRTMALLDDTPRPDQPGRTPVAMFSLLKPRTRIPPHVGASNARLVCHLPLVVPAGCGFRVGNTVREWQPGRAWVFDDTIEHEAWNDSHELRAILIWDTWHPALSAAERHMITAMNAALNAFSGADDSFSA